MMLCIPNWYHRFMSTQIAVRLPDAQVAFLDREVSQGRASSRAELVSMALRRMERERVAVRDLEIIIEAGGNPYPELEGMLEHVAATYPVID
jgi:Arc/MetJ-type ribon-helix-helix transcriptional regulator